MQAISSNFEDRPYSWGMAGGRPTTREGTEFGKRLSEARQRAGLTQMQLADRLGVSQKVVTYWERESVGLKADQLIALSDALAISVDELLGRGASAKQRGGPVGRARRVFDEVSALSRAQQRKILDVVEALVAQHSNGSS